MSLLSLPLVALARYFDPREWYSTHWLFAILVSVALVTIISVGATWIRNQWFPLRSTNVDPQTDDGLLQRRPLEPSPKQDDVNFVDFSLGVGRGAIDPSNPTGEEVVVVWLHARKYLENCTVQLTSFGRSAEHIGSFVGNVNPGTTEGIRVATRPFEIRMVKAIEGDNAQSNAFEALRYTGGVTVFPGTDHEHTTQYARNSVGWPVDVRVSHRHGVEHANATINVAFDSFPVGFQLMESNGFKRNSK